MTPHMSILRTGLTTIAASFKLMHELNARAKTKYDASNKVHERKLCELWDLAMPNEKLTDRFSSQWTKIGFQGQDPATDFRGMGMLGLDDLHYYAKTYPESYQRVLKTSHHETAWFSMAIVGINITDYILNLVRSRKLQMYFYMYGVSKEVYHEFYCYVFDTFEKKWSSSATPLTVMDFNTVFESLKDTVGDELLNRQPTVLNETSAILMKNIKNK